MVEVNVIGSVQILLSNRQSVVSSAAQNDRKPSVDILVELKSHDAGLSGMST
ncbi:MAG TPA: hypothetical protein VNT76_06730 [Candidatus Binatus sp.]|nr:hypothetical protein [Candidatus Binatus sp.]